MGSSAALIFSTVTGIYLLAVLLRFLLQVAKADFYNPVSQAVIKITDPMIRVLRTVIPGYKGIDFSSLVLAFVIEAVAICVLIILYGSDHPWSWIYHYLGIRGYRLIYRQNLLLRNFGVNSNVICHDVFGQHESSSTIATSLATD